MIAFTTARAARRFARGFCVPRVVARVAAHRFVIVHPNTAARRGWRII